MLVFFSVSILVLTVLVTPIMLSVNAGCDVLRNKGYVRLSLFFIPVYKAEVQLEHIDAKHNNILIRHGKKLQEIHINKDKEDDKSVMKFFKKIPILSAVRVRNLTLDISVGFADNAMTTTLTTAGVRVATLSAAAFFKSRERVRVRSCLTPVYGRNVLSADFFGIISLSLANIIYSFMEALKEKIKA